MELPEFLAPCVFPCDLNLSAVDRPPFSFTFVLTNASGTLHYISGLFHYAILVVSLNCDDFVTVEPFPHIRTVTCIQTTYTSTPSHIFALLCHVRIFRNEALRCSTACVRARRTGGPRLDARTSRR